MDIQLSDDTCALIQRFLDTGKFRSVDEIVRTALIVFEMRENPDEYEEIPMTKEEIEELRSRVRDADEQSARGEMIPAEVVFGRLRKRLAEMHQQEARSQKE